MKNNQKLLNISRHQNFVCVCVCVCVCLCLYKMVDISAETWNNAGVSVLRIHEDDDVNKTLLLLICISDISKGQGCANICDLIDKKIMRKCNVKKDEWTHKTTN